MPINLKDHSDANLVQAMEEIKVILKKHDITGLVLLVSADAMEMYQEVEASWSCAYRDTDIVTGFPIIRIKTTDLSEQIKKETLENTSGMFFGLVDGLNEAIELNEKIRQMLLKTGMEFSHITRRVKQ